MTNVLVNLTKNKCMNYLIFPKVLKGKAAEIHKAGRRKVTKFVTKGMILDGIIPSNDLFLYLLHQIRYESSN